MDSNQRIAILQQEINNKRLEIKRLRRTNEATELQNYDLKDTDGKSLKLSDLFDGQHELMVIHNMGKGCAYCTLWADGFNGFTDHLNNRIPFVLISPDAPADAKAFSEGRNWKFRVISSQGTSLKKESGFESPEGTPLPGVAVLVKEGDKILQQSRDSFGPGDDYCSIWHLLDLIPGTTQEWKPKFEY